MSTRKMIFPLNARAARRLKMVPVNAMGHPVDARLSHPRSTAIGRPAISRANVSGLGADVDVNAVLDGAQATLGMQGQIGTAKLYPELMTSLNKVYKDRVATLPFVPKTWLSQVLAIQGSGPGILLFPIRATNIFGFPNNGVPKWVAQNSPAWDMIADEAKAVIQKYMDGKIAEGRVAMAQFSSDDTFWGQVRLKTIAVLQAANQAGEMAKAVLAPKKTLLILAGLVVAGIGLVTLRPKRA